jgi:hypothetical protein
MIAAPIIKAIAFPWILVDEQDRIVHSGAGSLFNQPEAKIEGAMSALETLAVGGWARCAAGFAMYRFTTEAIAPLSVVLYGLKVNGISTAQGRTAGLSVRMDPQNLLDYVTDYCAGVEALDDSYRMLIRENIHEIRGINSALYNTAYELDSAVRGTVQASAPSLSKSVVRWSELLSGRIDFMEFIANPNALNTSKVEISVYKKFDKVQRCFRVTANRTGIRINMQGSSNGTVYGPPIFDIVPYLLLDNAVKYSPPDMPITVMCNESDQSIFCRVTSTGPTLNEDEKQAIFESSVRGKNAVRTGKGGSGFGLPVLSRIVKRVFDGTVSLDQRDIGLTIKDVPHSEIAFEIKLPLYVRRGRLPN